MRTVIIGGVAGGASAAARLRRLDEKREIIILERGEYVSFANCGLPYYIGGVIRDREDLTLQTPEGFKRRFNIDVRVRHEAVKIDTDKKIVAVRDLVSGKEYSIGYDELIISTGAKPVLPSIDGVNRAGVFTLRSIPDTIAIKEFIRRNEPRSAVVIGGGYIGVEMAENLSHAGLDVAIAEMSDHVIASLDFDMAAEVHKYLRSMGIKLYLNSKVTSIGDGSVSIGDREIPADLVIMAVGVRPDTSLAVDAGILTNSRGGIVTDRQMRTSAPDVYAVGDAVEIRNFLTDAPAFIPLAGPANKQGRIAADNIAGGFSTYDGTQGTSVMKLFDMAVATTGLNEKSAREAGINYDKTYISAMSHAGYYPGATGMTVKVLWNRDTSKLIGAQIVGFDGVDKRCDVIATAIRYGADVTSLANLELSYAPPFGSAKDPVNMVGFVAENIITGKVKQFFWHDVADLPRDGSVTFLDTRTVSETEFGRIPGFINIPLDELRERIDEIPKDRPVYVHCHSGLRSYIACRILTGNGYDCYNLAGGWKLYESVTNEIKLEKNTGNK